MNCKRKAGKKKEEKNTRKRKNKGKIHDLLKAGRKQKMEDRGTKGRKNTRRDYFKWRKQEDLLSASNFLQTSKKISSGRANGRWSNFQYCFETLIKKHQLRIANKKMKKALR